MYGSVNVDLCRDSGETQQVGVWARSRSAFLARVLGTADLRPSIAQVSILRDGLTELESRSGWISSCLVFLGLFARFKLLHVCVLPSRDLYGGFFVTDVSVQHLDS